MKPGKVSYIKNPFARRGIISFGLCMVALLGLLLGIFMGVATNGEVALRIAAIGFCSFLLSLFSLGYGILSFFEQEVSYRLSKVSVVISGLLLLSWCIVILIGLGGS